MSFWRSSSGRPWLSAATSTRSKRSRDHRRFNTSSGRRRPDYQPTQGDLVYQFHPWWEETGRQLRRGELPRIQPGVGGGLPLMANGQTGLWAPVMLPVWLHGPERGTTIMAFWKIELAGLGAFLLFFNVLRLRWAAAAVGGVAWAGTPYLVAWLLVPLAWATAMLPCGVVGRVVGRAPPSADLGCRRGGRLLRLADGFGASPGDLGTSSAVRRCSRPSVSTRDGGGGSSVVAGVAGVVALALSWPTVGYIAASSRGPTSAPTARPTARACHGRFSVISGGRSWCRQRWAIRDVATGAPNTRTLPGRPGSVGRCWRCSRAVASGGGTAEWRWRPAPRRSSGWSFSFVFHRSTRCSCRIPPARSDDGPAIRRTDPVGIDRPRCAGLRRRPAGPSRARLRYVSSRRFWLRLSPSSPHHGRSTYSISCSWGSRSRWPWLWVCNFERLVPLLVGVELALLAVGINPVASASDRLPRPPLLERLIALEAGNPCRIMGIDGSLMPNIASRYGLRDLRASDPLRPLPFARLMGVFGEPPTILGGPLRRAPVGLMRSLGRGPRRDEAGTGPAGLEKSLLRPRRRDLVEPSPVARSAGGRAASIRNRRTR